MKKTLVATKNLTYNTRRLTAGDEFQATGPMARALVAIGKAELKPSGFVVPSSPPTAPAAAAKQAVSAPADDDDNDTDDADAEAADALKAVRAEYEKVVGKRPFMGWDEAELRRRMAEHTDAGSS